jgi:hypothetical protein
MIARQAWIGIGILALLAPTAPAADHPLHMSRAIVEHNAESGSFEVSLYAFADDVAEALEIEAGRPIDLDQDPVLEELLFELVADQFHFRVDGLEPAKPRWVGYELEGEKCWMYFEYPAGKTAPAKVSAQNRILMDQFDDQLNVVYVRIGERQRCLTFRTDAADWQNWDLRRGLAAESGAGYSTK